MTLPIDTIITGDCLEVMKDWPDNCVDLCLTDPPYLVGAKGCGLAGDREYLKEITAKKLDIGFDSLILDKFHNWFCFCGKQQLHEIIERAEKGNWQLITWCKTNPTPLVNNNYLPDCEYIIHKYSRGRLFGSYHDKSRFIVSQTGKSPYEHPTVKPLHIVEKLIRLGSEPNDLILDPFCGSGTTCVAAKMLGRNYIGIDISEEYCKIARMRIKAVDTGVPVKEQLKGQMGLFE